MGWTRAQKKSHKRRFAYAQSKGFFLQDKIVRLNANRTSFAAGRLKKIKVLRSVGLEAEQLERPASSIAPSPCSSIVCPLSHEPVTSTTEDMPPISPSTSEVGNLDNSINATSDPDTVNFKRSSSRLKNNDPEFALDPKMGSRQVIPGTRLKGVGKDKGGRPTLASLVLVSKNARKKLSRPKKPHGPPTHFAEGRIGRTSTIPYVDRAPFIKPRDRSVVKPKPPPKPARRLQPSRETKDEANQKIKDVADKEKPTVAEKRQMEKQKSLTPQQRGRLGSTHGVGRKFNDERDKGSLRIKRTQDNVDRADRNRQKRDLKRVQSDKNLRFSSPVHSSNSTDDDRPLACLKKKLAKNSGTSAHTDKDILSVGGVVAPGSVSKKGTNNAIYKNLLGKRLADMYAVIGGVNVRVADIVTLIPGTYVFDVVIDGILLQAADDSENVPYMVVSAVISATLTQYIYAGTAEQAFKDDLLKKVENAKVELIFINVHNAVNEHYCIAEARIIEKNILLYDPFFNNGTLADTERSGSSSGALLTLVSHVIKIRDFIEESLGQRGQWCLTLGSTPRIVDENDARRYLWPWTMDYLSNDLMAPQDDGVNCAIHSIFYVLTRMNHRVIRSAHVQNLMKGVKGVPKYKELRELLYVKFAKPAHGVVNV